jgi:hypothetical protein
VVETRGGVVAHLPSWVHRRTWDPNGVSADGTMTRGADSPTRQHPYHGHCPSFSLLIGSFGVPLGWCGSESC